VTAGYAAMLIAVMSYFPATASVQRLDILGNQLEFEWTQVD
jgi:hypothetical protein